MGNKTERSDDDRFRISVYHITLFFKLLVDRTCYYRCSPTEDLLQQRTECFFASTALVDKLQRPDAFETVVIVMEAQVRTLKLQDARALASAPKEGYNKATKSFLAFLDQLSR